MITFMRIRPFFRQNVVFSITFAGFEFDFCWLDLIWFGSVLICLDPIRFDSIRFNPVYSARFAEFADRSAPTQNRRAAATGSAVKTAVGLLRGAGG